MSKYRSRFLKFLGILWEVSIMNVVKADLRCILDIQTELTQDELYYEMAEYFGKCLQSVLFLSQVCIELPISEKKISLLVPSAIGKHTYMMVFKNHWFITFNV